MTGYFITLDGVDGCGKTTQVKNLYHHIEREIKSGISSFSGVIMTREPGDTPLGMEIRKLLLSGQYEPVPEAELFLFLADRAQHVRDVIIPALENNICVICDRFTDSTRAYQLAARSISTGSDSFSTDSFSTDSFSTDSFEDMLKVAECGISPDIRLWLDIETKYAIERLNSRSDDGGESNRMDNESIEFHQAVNNAYKKQYTLEFPLKSNIICIDAKQSVDIVSENIIKSYESFNIDNNPSINI